MRTWKSVSVGSIVGSILAVALGTIWSCNAELGSEGEDAGTEDGSVWMPPGPPDLRRYDPDAFWENDPPESMMAMTTLAEPKPCVPSQAAWALASKPTVPTGEPVS